MDKKEKKQKSEQKSVQHDNEIFFSLDAIASSTECTGLIPSAPVDPAESESYMEIYNIHFPEEGENNHLQQD